MYQLRFWFCDLTGSKEFESQCGVQGAGADQNIDFEDGEVSCEGVNEEECLMRRTLVAHVDYIYTQKHKRP